MLIAGGGTAGHVQPALAVADALVAADPTVRITCLGTAGGLETILVPERGYRLELVPEVKFRRKLNLEALRIPGRLIGTVRAASKVIKKDRIDIVVGFGGYVSLPAYLAARLSLRHRVPVVVHEANARAGIANKIGARLAAVVVAAVPGSCLKGARVVGNPVRRSLSGLDLAALRPEAREYFGLDPDAPTLLVIGGSLGAIKLNDAFSSVAADLGRAGVGVLHAHGRAKPVVLPEPEPGTPAYVATPYLDRMDLAYAAADLIVARSGAITVAEIGALGVPVVYVPLAFGNGEQRLNAVPQAQSGAAVIISEDELTPAAILDRIVPLVKDRSALAAMSAAASTSSTQDADRVIAGIVLDTAHSKDTR
ncbi:UDP-N-acetylglucosamine--N-acetylmuramyl-(pentapeptide) pyrophosphoryl-undecaprenol N-acetylglucosamine transferase [Nakamurella panacisegetis]|uniref:UDP-N-acetylglucosamine--N-acetylmuramyl- (pentapeptide) pyrophosphoryl-undecaprenol N-acetylglucosamine transferase n=1 Tax=Nakamurella panacisegetis TaxID=1090615 RepID=UPI0015608AA3